MRGGDRRCTIERSIEKWRNRKRAPCGTWATLAHGDDNRAIVRRFLRGCLPALAEAPIDRTETCLYTVTPDEHFRLDFHPGRRDVIVASPCSGHGFKFSCLVGSILADPANQDCAALPR